MLEQLLIFNVFLITLKFIARHWLWLPDDGSYVNRNMLEQLLHF